MLAVAGGTLDWLEKCEVLVKHRLMNVDMKAANVAESILAGRRALGLHNFGFDFLKRGHILIQHFIHVHEFTTFVQSSFCFHIIRYNFHSISVSSV